MSKAFEFSVNGKAVSVTPTNEETPLLNVLGNELGLMGTRFGCGLEQCGCCMVLIDGEAVKSCAKPVWSVVGKKSLPSKAWAALGAHIGDLTLTCERVMPALLKQ